MNRARAGAFFDFDKTLLDDDSAKYALKYLWERRRLPAGYILRVLALNQLYKRDLCSEERMVRQLLTYYRNRSMDEFIEGAEDFHNDYIVPHLAPNIVDRVREHRESGDVLVLVSGSLRYILNYVARDLGFDYLYCTDLEVGADGLLTGAPADGLVMGERKRAVVWEVAELEELDLAASHAYGNHHSDIPMLESVGHPHVVAPTKTLRKVAGERGWPELSHGNRIPA
ncbi:MAG: HAD family hydrolase [Desulfatibacillaceae bacterium]